MKDKHLKDIQHKSIRYASCWEDADILLEGLNVQKGDKVLSIASAGDNSLSLLVNDPELVVAIDINPLQLYLLELKIAAFKTLSHDEFLVFLGFKKGNPMNCYPIVNEYLSEKASKYWGRNTSKIRKGVVFQGKFERYLGFFAKKVMPLIYKKKTIEHLFVEKSESEQLEFFHNKWNNWKWRMMFKLFFSRRLMSWFGRDPKFFDQVDISVTQFLADRSMAHLTSKVLFENYFLRYVFLGNFGDQLPHYARKENFDKIKSNIGLIKLYKGFAQDAFEVFGQFDKFNLSNIFEYMDEDVFEKVGEDLLKGAKEEAKFAYWNLMIPRELSLATENFQRDVNRDKDLSKKDKCFFYRQFVTENVVYG